MTDDGVLVRVNGKDKGVFQMPHAEAFHALRIEAFDDTHMALDDILLYGLAPLPADYVEEPKPVKEKGYHVGLHVFSSWRYGFWRGRHDATWDVCSPYDEITPVYGLLGQRHSRRLPTGKTNGSANTASISSYNAGTDRLLLMNLSNFPAFLMRFTTATSTPFTRTIPSLPSCGKTTSQKPSRPKLLKSTLFPSLSSIISKIPAITK